MAISFNTYYIPHTTRRKYGDYPTESVVSSANQGGGGAAGGGVGSTEYMTSFQTDNISAGTWTVTGATSFSALVDGIAIKVKFNTDSNGELAANTIDLGFGTEEETGTTFPKPIYITPDQLVTDEIKEGDELMLTYRDYLSGWTIDASNERYARDLWEFMDSGTIISKYNVASSGDVMAFGAEEYTGYTELSVIDDLETTSDPYHNVLSANQGKVLADMIDDLASSAITQIKTINGQSLIGEGDIEITGGTGSTSYTAGSGITIINDEISLDESVWDMLDDKYDKTGGTISGDVYVEGEVAAEGDIMSYGASSVVPSGFSVINRLDNTSTTDALSANMGKYLNEHKQETLVSGTNIKTINNQSLLGSGNINIQGGGGAEYTGGTNIGINNYVISVTGTVESASSATTSASATTANNSLNLGGTPASGYALASQITDLSNDLDDKYDKTGGTVNGNVIATGYVAASGDVMSYGASSAIPAQLTIIDAIDSGHTSGTPHYLFALSAYQGWVLNRDKQDKLIWTGNTANIKTINGYSLEGPGNITIQGGGGTEYVGGTNISISNGTISVTGTVQSAASATTAADTAKFDGMTSNYYAKTNGSYSTMTAGTSNYATALGTSSANYTKATLDTALGNKLGKTETAADSTKWGGYKIVIGSIPSSPSSDTIYFGT